MIHRAMTNPHQTFMDGMKGFAEDRKQKNKEKVIDFLDHLREKRNKSKI